MKSGIAYIISNPPGKKHRGVFEKLCNKSIACAKEHLRKMPVAVLTIEKCEGLNADQIDGSSLLNRYVQMNCGKEMHGLVAAELLKTHIHEWSPFDKTLYIDCDAFIMKSAAKHYIEALSMGYKLSMATTASMAWKDCIADTSVRKNVFGDIPEYFPYWNFGIFGSSKESGDLLEKIRNEFLTYCFKGNSNFGSCPHAQPAVVRAAHSLGPNHGIFTMPARYNAHFAAAGGYAFSGSPVILHMWKDVRELVLRD